jgi:hypothetical protein
MQPAGILKVAAGSVQETAGEGLILAMNDDMLAPESARRR